MLPMGVGNARELEGELSLALSSGATKSVVSRSAPVELIRALNVIFPSTGPGGYFRDGSLARDLGTDAQGLLLGRKIARTFVRAWMEKEMGDAFGLNRHGLKPSLQIETKPNRPFPNVSLKWNKATRGMTDRLRIEDATIRYLKDRLSSWGNNRSPNNNYVEGSTSAKGFAAPAKTVYFDHLVTTGDGLIANEAFTGKTPGVGDIEAWVYLAKEGVVAPGMIFNFQNEPGHSIGEKGTRELVSEGYKVSVVPYTWWSQYLSRWSPHS